LDARDERNGPHGSDDDHFDHHMHGEKCNLTGVEPSPFLSVGELSYVTRQVYCGFKPFPYGPCKTVSIAYGNVNVDGMTINSIAFQSVVLPEAVSPSTTTSTTATPTANNV
jgi:hypothetical protein